MDIGVTFEDCICTVDFYLDDEYPYCDIEFSTKDEGYQKLDFHKRLLSQTK